MLVSGLINEALSTKISSSNGDYASVYQALCECAQEMVDKYRQKQETPENRSKLEVKTRAATVLFRELRKVPRGADAGVIHDALSSALERHADELQGCEHLLSEKSSNYALIRQTQGLRQQAGAPVSLLRYHHLKNKLLGPDSPLGDKQKEFISGCEKTGLKLDLASLDLLDKYPDFLTPDMMKLWHEEIELPVSKELEPICSGGVGAFIEQQLKTDIESLKANMEQLETDREQLESDIEQLETSMEPFKMDMEPLKTDIEQLKKDMEQLETRIDMEQPETGMEQLKIKTAMEQLKTAIEQVKTTTEQLKTTTERLKARERGQSELLSGIRIYENPSAAKIALEEIKARRQGLLKSEARDEVVKHEKLTSDNV